MSSIELNLEPRKQQQDALNFFSESISSGKKNLLFEMPTGVGKSYFVMMAARWYLENVNKFAKFDIITNTKLLQDQYIKDFNFIKNIKGKNNYKCEKSSKGNTMSCEEGSEYNQLFKEKCTDCPYKKALNAYKASEMSLANFHFYSVVSTYVPNFYPERKSNVLFIDECHGFEEIYCDFITSTISRFSLVRLGIWSDELEVQLYNTKTIKQFAKFLSSVIIPRMSKMLDTIKSQKDSSYISEETRRKYAKNYSRLDKALCKYNRFVNDEENHETNWIFQRDQDTRGNWTLKVEPVWAYQYISKLWEQYDHIICMSATILSRKLLSYLMGFDENKTSYFSISSPFDKKNRMVYYKPVGKFSFKEKKGTYPFAIQAIEVILEQFKDSKGIIHTGNYEFARYIQNNLKNKRLLFHDSSNRAEVYNYHLENTDSSVIVSPSMMQGIDLKDELSRFQIISKVPFPSLGSKKIKRRLDTNPLWYNWKTALDIIQASGRSIRSYDDHATTIILDECFSGFMHRNKSLIPQYYLEALVIK